MPASGGLFRNCARAARSPSSAVQEGRQGLEPQITQMIRVNLGPRGRPVGRRHMPFAVFAVFAVPLLLAHSRRTQGQNGVSRGASAPAEFRVGCGAVQWRRSAGLGLVVADRRRLAAARAFRGNCATTLPPGQAPIAGPTPSGCAAPGKEGRRSGGVIFAKLRSAPGLRRGRLLPPGSARTGSREMCNDPRVRCERVRPWVSAPRVCAMQRSGTGLVAARTGLGLWGRAPRSGSLRDPALVRS